MARIILENNEYTLYDFENEADFEKAVIESYDIEPKDILRPMFDLIWNACGFKRSHNFDEAGNWTAK